MYTQKKATKFKMCEVGCATILIEATTFYEDCVFPRIADLLR